MKKFYVLKTTSSQIGVSGFDKSNFDFDSGCQRCGTGSKFVGNLVVKQIEIVKKDLFATFNFDILISEKLYKIISAEIQNFTLSQTINPKGELLPYFHLFSESVFPKMNKSSEGTQRFRGTPSCKECDRDAYFDKIIFQNNGEPSIIVDKKYNYTNISEDFIMNSEIFMTWEGFGKSVMSNDTFYIARPQIIISEKIKSIFEKQKIKKVTYGEVVIN
ncbi:MAG: hypothetical protein ACKVOU_11030 [Cytophagales bacterium]